MDCAPQKFGPFLFYKKSEWVNGDGRYLWVVNWCLWSGLNPFKKITVVGQVDYKGSLVSAAWPLGSAIDAISSRTESQELPPQEINCST